MPVWGWIAVGVLWSLVAFVEIGALLYRRRYSASPNERPRYGHDVAAKLAAAVLAAFLIAGIVVPLTSEMSSQDVVLWIVGLPAAAYVSMALVILVTYCAARALARPRGGE